MHIFQFIVHWKDFYLICKVVKLLASLLKQKRTAFRVEAYAWLQRKSDVEAYDECFLWKNKYCTSIIVQYVHFFLVINLVFHSLFNAPDARGASIRRSAGDD